MTLLLSVVTARVQMKATWYIDTSQPDNIDSALKEKFVFLKRTSLWNLAGLSYFSFHSAFIFDSYESKANLLDISPGWVADYTNIKSIDNLYRFMRIGADEGFEESLWELFL